MVFATSSITAALTHRLELERITPVLLDTTAGNEQDAALVMNLARAHRARWVVVDGYNFDDQYQSCLVQSGLNVLFIDDNVHCRHYSAQLVLNQNSHAVEDMYISREPYTRLLLGSLYVMLRREFAPWRNYKRETPAIARNVLITMGGSDPNDLSSRVIRALSQVAEDLDVTVAIGGSNPHRQSIERAASQLRGRLRLIENPSDLPALMAWAELAVVAGGGTLWELMYMGCPILSYSRNPEQKAIISLLSEKGALLHVGDAADVDAHKLVSALKSVMKSPCCRASMARRGQDRIDSKGSERVCERLLLDSNCA